MDVKAKQKKVLYITYDGLTDPLGSSQILPYIIGLSKDYHFTILSCEKKKRFEKNKNIIEKICRENKINWEHIFFKTKPPLIAKYIDFVQLNQKALLLHKKHNFDLIHCRSYISIEIGLMLKRKFGVKVLFDMRGLWVDERVEGGLWNLKNPIYKYAYKKYKEKEINFIRNSDQIISLTEAAKSEIQKWPSYKTQVPITVIPCMVDFRVFNKDVPISKEEAKKNLGFHSDDYVVSYLGSLGTWYLLEEMLEFFFEIKQKYPKAKFLFVTPEPPEIVLTAAEKKGLTVSDFKIIYAQRSEVPERLKASDVSLVFIKNCYSKIASSPTKLGELMALGIPVVCNGGIGDVDKIINSSKGGLILKDFSKESMHKVIEKFTELQSLDPVEISESIKPYYDLNKGVSLYSKVYKNLLDV